MTVHSFWYVTERVDDSKCKSHNCVKMVIVVQLIKIHLRKNKAQSKTLIR